MNLYDLLLEAIENWIMRRHVKSVEFEELAKALDRKIVMMEVWLQITCNGCGDTDNSVLPNQTKAEFRAEKHQCGWRRTTNDLDYCGKCMAKGALKKLPDMFMAD